MKFLFIIAISIVGVNAFAACKVPQQYPQAVLMKLIDIETESNNAFYGSVKLIDSNEFQAIKLAVTGAHYDAFGTDLPAIPAPNDPVWEVIKKSNCTKFIKSIDSIQATLNKMINR